MPLQLLEDASAEHVSVGLPAHHQDRDGVHKGIAQSYYGIKCPGTYGSEDRQWLAFDPIVAIGQVDGALLMPHLYCLDAIFSPPQSIDQTQTPVTRYARQIGDSLTHQVFKDELAACKPHIAYPLWIMIEAKLQPPTLARICQPYFLTILFPSRCHLALSSPQASRRRCRVL